MKIRLYGAFIGACVGFFVGNGTGIVGGAFGARAGVGVFLTIGAIIGFLVAGELNRILVGRRKNLPFTKKKPGTLYGVGTGPGDPELMTLKAHRLIQSAPVIAYPAPDSGESFARRIAAQAIPEGAREIPIVIPMRPERFPAQDVYDAAAQSLAAELEAGRDVVVLCEGDPFFYGSFMYLFARLSERFPSQIVPGVSSLGAVTAAAQRPLCARADVLTVLPATLDAATLRARLAVADAAAIMKLGRHFSKARAVIDELGLTERAVLVRHASLPEQGVSPLSEAPETVPYFSMILIPGKDAYV